ncbi:MAG TPA: FxSxx-COOH system tetratricopeptide repeat protein [Ktedonobacteraceae bacterium]|nr:FxSxx-COOH system tetratricopeptide repeat protein [Ktedonobacteraceae bacterium]
MTRSAFSSFGTILKGFRTRRGLTQHTLAEKLGVRRNTIGNWERGDFLPQSKGVVLELARLLHLDEEEIRQLLEASLIPAPHWLVPLRRNSYFTGREEILKALHTQLGADRAVALTQSSALHGLGGIGKTQIALEYVYRYALEYSAVFWIGAETEEQIIAGLLHVAETLGLPERAERDQQLVVTAVQRWLSTHGQWLLVWDNVEDFVLLDRFLPSTRSGAILLTTRRQALGTCARGLDLLPMEQEEGILFLLRRAKVLSPEATGDQLDQYAERMPAQYAVASELVTALGGLPLALDQAGAYLEETRCGLSAYLDLFRTRRDALLQRRGEGIQDHPASVSTTFTLAITAAAERSSVVRELMQICALLQPDAIPEELFLQGSEHLGPQLQAVGSDPLEWDRVLGIACAYSLLSRQPEVRTLSVHRLVQAVLLDTMTEHERAARSQQAIEALDAIFPQMRTTSGNKLWNAYRPFPHALLFLQRAGCAEESLVMASLAYKTGQYLHQQSNYAQAEALFQRALSIRERLLDADHPLIASSLHALAAASQTQGNYAQAETLFQRALRSWEKTAEPDEGEMASILRWLGFISWQQAKYEQAEGFYQRALRLQEKIGLLHDPEGAFAFHDLALLYHDESQYARAEELYQQARQIWEQTLGPDHPWVGHALKNLADLYREQGNTAQAEGLYRRARQIWEQALGPDHLWMAYVLHGLALFSQQQGRYSEAEALFQRTLAIREQQLGEQHPETAWTLHDLALFHHQQGKVREALALATRALTIRSQALGDAHPKTIATRTLCTQLAQGQADEAEPTLEPLRTLLKARGWSLHLKKRHDKPYVYASRKVGQHTQSRYLAPLSNLAVCLAAARMLPNAKEE